MHGTRSWHGEGVAIGLLKRMEVDSATHEKLGALVTDKWVVLREEGGELEKVGQYQTYTEADQAYVDAVLSAGGSIGRKTLGGMR